MRHPSSLDPRPSRRFPLRTASFAISAALCVGACKKDDENEQAKTEDKASDEAAKTDESDSAEKEGVGDAAAKVVGEAATIADNLSPATDIQRGDVLGHVLFPNPSQFLSDIKTQAAPSSVSFFLDETMLRNMASGQLGSRAKVAENLDLKKPFGCVLVDSAAVEAPIACVMGYTGGAKALTGDLGSQGQAADAGSHVAAYEVEGQKVYIDDLGDMVVLSNHDELMGKAKPYLEKTLIARAPDVANDIEMVAFVGAAMERYKDKLEPMFNDFENLPTPAGSTPLSTAMADFSKASNKKNLEMFQQTEQATVGISLEDQGAVIRWAWFPKLGSKYAEEWASYAAGPLDVEVLKKLPAAAWAIAGYRFQVKGESETLTELRNVLAEAYASETGKDPAAVKDGVKQFFEETQKVYRPDVVFGMMHVADTPGAMVIGVGLQEGQSGKDLWRKWSKDLTPENVLTKDAAEKVTWSYEQDAATVSGAAVDRIVFAPTEAGKKEMSGSDAEAFKKKVGEPQLVIDIAEADGMALMVLSLGDAAKVEKSTAAAIEAAQGKGTIADAPGFTDLSKKVTGMSSMFAVDVQRASDWVRWLMPPEDASKIPAALGNDLTDVFVLSAVSSKDGSSTGEMVFSQPFVDKLRALADK